MIPTDGGPYETADTIILGAKGVGRVTKARLAKWHRAGLIHKPHTEALGRGKGSESRYPVGTLALVLEILKRSKQRRKHADLAWDLWWDGLAVPDATIRKILGTFAKKWDDCLKGDLKLDIEKMKRQRLPKRVGKFRKRAGRQAFPAVAKAILSVLSPQIDESAVDEVDAKTYDKTFDLKQARTFRTREAEPFIQSDQHHMLRMMGTVLRGKSMTVALAGYEDADLRSSRDRYRKILDVFGRGTRQTNQMHGKGAFGFAQLNAQATPTTRNEQKWIVLGWPLLTAIPEMREGVSTLIGNEETLNNTDQAFARIKLLREEVPAAGKVASIRRLGEAQRSKKKQARLDADLRRLKRTHGPEIREFFDRHPVDENNTKKRAESGDGVQDLPN